MVVNKLEKGELIGYMGLSRTHERLKFIIEVTEPNEQSRERFGGKVIWNEERRQHYPKGFTSDGWSKSAIRSGAFIKMME